MHAVTHLSACLMSRAAFSPTAVEGLCSRTVHLESASGPGLQTVSKTRAAASPARKAAMRTGPAWVTVYVTVDHPSPSNWTSPANQKEKHQTQRSIRHTLDVQRGALQMLFSRQLHVFFVVSERPGSQIGSDTSILCRCRAAEKCVLAPMSMLD